MASNYPNSFDTFATNHVAGETIDEDTDNDQADALNKIERELGTDPSGAFTDVKQRFDLMDFARVLNGKGFVNHGATASIARPPGYASIEWYGSVQPTNAANGDTWIDTSV